jgi:hypothetical protein
MKQFKITWMEEMTMECDVILKDDITEEQLAEIFNTGESVVLEDGVEVDLIEYCQSNGSTEGGSMPFGDCSVDGIE